MKSVKAVVIVPTVRVQLNTSNKDKHQWATIIDARGQRIHTGQPKYIKRVAKKKFNLDLRW